MKLKNLHTWEQSFVGRALVALGAGSRFVNAQLNPANQDLYVRLWTEAEGEVILAPDGSSDSLVRRIYPGDRPIYRESDILGGRVHESP